MTLILHESLVPQEILHMEGLVERFLASVDVKANSKETYREQLKIFVRWVNARYTFDKMHSIKREDICAYRDSLIAEKKSSYTVTGYLSAVKKFFEWLECERIYPDIAKKVRSMKHPRGFRKDCLTKEQIRSALSVFDTSTVQGLRDFALFNLLVRTGIRGVEVSRTCVQDLRQQNGQAILLIQGKGRDTKDEYVLLMDEALGPIRKYLSRRGPTRESDPLFSSLSDRSYGKGLTVRTISWIIKETLRKIHIDDSRITAHSLRHTAVSLCIQGGATLIQAQSMARHTDPKTTMIYFHNHDRITSGGERFVSF